MQVTYRRVIVSRCQGCEDCSASVWKLCKDFARQSGPLHQYLCSITGSSCPVSPSVRYEDTADATTEVEDVPSGQLEIERVVILQETIKPSPN